MFTRLPATVTTGVGNAKQTIDFEYDALVPTTDITTAMLIEKYAGVYTYARIIKLINEDNKRNAGNNARTKKRIKPEDKLVHAMQYAVVNLAEDFQQRCTEEGWLLNTVWPMCADSYIAK